MLDVAWSRTQFLLSSSMDQTVRLWHVSMAECLRIFTHPDFVTAIDFHPINDKVEFNDRKTIRVSLSNVLSSESLRIPIFLIFLSIFSFL